MKYKIDNVIFLKHSSVSLSVFALAPQFVQREEGGGGGGGVEMERRGVEVCVGVRVGVEEGILRERNKAAPPVMVLLSLFLSPSLPTASLATLSSHF